LIYSFEIDFRLPMPSYYTSTLDSPRLLISSTCWTPWCYPDDDTSAILNVKAYLHSVVDKAASAHISNKTEARKTESLLSPLLPGLLMKKGGRPYFVLKAKKRRSTPSERSVFTAAATVARKQSSQPVDLPIVEGIRLQNFRLPSPPLTIPSLFSHFS